MRGHRRCIEIVFAKGIWQAGVRVRRDVALGDAGEFLHVLAQFIRAEGTVEAKREGIRVAQGVVKRFRRLTGKGAPGGIRNGARDHNRQIDAQRFHLFLHRKDRSFRVEGVEHRFDHDQIAAPFHQRFGGFTIGFDQLIKSHVTEGRIVHIR
ncbi:hypothetical protein D3C72_1395520 [compost metagenome]